MPTAIDQRCQAHARPLRPHIESTYTFRTVKLVGRKRHQVDPAFFNVDGHVSDRLSSVTMENNAFLLGYFANLGDRMNRPDLVIGEHNRDKHGLIRYRLAHVVGIDHPVLVYRQISDDRFSSALKRLAAIQNRLVLGNASDDVVALFLVKLDHALYRHVIGLGCAAGENNLLGLSVNKRGDLRPSLVDRLFGFPAKTMVSAGSITE